MSILPEELRFLTNGRLPQKTYDNKAESKTVLISGATSGIGKETVYKFAENDATIIIVVRNEEKAKQLQQEIKDKYNTTISYYIADFNDFDSVREVVKTISTQIDKIDILINSVGIYNTKRILTKENNELTFHVNHLAVFLFTVLMIPLLRKDTASRIIQVNSQGHRFNGLRINKPNFKGRIYTGLKGYGQSKVAQLYTVYELANMLKETNITINAMHPGAVLTNIGQNNGKLYRLWFKIFTKRILKNPRISADALYYLSLSEDLDAISGKFFNLTILEKPAWHATKIAKKGKAVWDITTSLTNITLPYGGEIE